MVSKHHAARLLPRLAGWVIDSTIPATLAGLALLLNATIENRMALAAFIAAIAFARLGWALLLWWGYATRGAGVGFRAMHLRLLDAEDARPIGWGRYLLRQVVWTLLAIPVLPLLLMLVFLVADPARRGWHDLASGAVAVEAPASEPAAEDAPSPLFGQPRTSPDWQAHGTPELTDTRRSGRVRPSTRRGVTGLENPTVPTTRRQPAQWESAPEEAATRLRARGAPSAERLTTPLPGGRSGAEGWYIALDDGREFDVTGLIVLGRKPSQPPGRTDSVLITAGEGDYAVSKSHLTLGVDERGVWVKDNNSTNGTAVVNRHGEFEPCPKGAQVRLREGQLVAYGDRGLTLRRRPIALTTS